MEIIYITFLSIVNTIVLIFIIYKLLKTQETILKLIKSNSLYEFEEIEGLKEEINEEKEVEKQRYVDINTISDEELKKVKINPDYTYKGVIGGNIKQENFF